MSRKIGMDTICLRPTPRLAHTEYSMEYHVDYLRRLGQPLADAWEFADVPYYPEKMTALAYRYGINYIVYAMTH